MERLRQCGIQPTPQRLAIAAFVLETSSHPTADEVYSQVQPNCSTLSRATVYNTLHLMVERGILKAQRIQDEIVHFDANTEVHHHFVDESTGRIFDIPWNALQLQGHQELEAFEVSEYQVILRGRLKP